MLGMTHNENSPRVSRLETKRTADSMVERDSHPQSPAKKRAFLGEISNLKDVMLTEQKLKAVQEIETKFDDSQMCDGYVTDIYDYLRNKEKEAKRRPLHDYIEKVQKDMTANMRGVLVDWLVEVAEEYKLQSNTLYLSVSYVDKFLSINPINKKKLQLLGVSSMLIASKFEEINPPTVDDFCYITDNTYRKEDVMKMEAEIVKSLKFEVSSPTILTFLRRFASISEEDCKDPILEFELLGCYLAELSLLDYGCLKFLPSMIASSVIFLSRFIFHPDKHPWNANLQKYSGYKAADLKECVVIIQDLQLGKRGGSLVAIREKYNQHKFKYVGLMKCPLEIPNLFFEEMRLFRVLKA
ncbi:putative cyclin-A3-1 [Impatiens glandulifera]|uniref:putative cyclin-A3-1 n=1 Tax=Impatiens glandulifera TaxID=253017 RepID=UPI001FB12A38|nr:putative cyclin-A3-1 [Impatiens glandulifera]